MGIEPKKGRDWGDRYREGYREGGESAMVISDKYEHKQCRISSLSHDIHNYARLWNAPGISVKNNNQKMVNAKIQWPCHSSRTHLANSH